MSNPSIQPVSVTNFASTQFRTAYGPKLRVRIQMDGEGRTKQSFRDECDINRIMARYQATGVLEHQRADVQGQFRDCTEWDFQRAMDIVAEARSTFAGLPAELRDRFENDPRKLLEFVHDPANLEESVQLGFIDPERLPKDKAATPLATPPSPTPAAASETGAGASPKPTTPPGKPRAAETGGGV